MVQIFGMFSLLWVSMFSPYQGYTIQNGDTIPSVSAEKVYSAIVDIIKGSKYSEDLYEEAWDMMSAMAWESFADMDGLGSSNPDKVIFNPTSHTYNNSGLLAVGLFQLNVNHFADWILEDMYNRGYTDLRIPFSSWKTKKGHWKADVNPHISDRRQQNFDASVSWLKNPDNEAAILHWASNPDTWNTQIKIAQEAFNDREKQKVYGGEAWDAYKTSLDKGQDQLFKAGITRDDQAEFHSYYMQPDVEGTVEEEKPLEHLYKFGFRIHE